MAMAEKKEVDAGGGRPNLYMSGEEAGGVRPAARQLLAGGDGGRGRGGEGRGREEEGERAELCRPAHTGASKVHFLLLHFSSLLCDDDMQCFCLFSTS